MSLVGSFVNTPNDAHGYCLHSWMQNVARTTTYPFSTLTEIVRGKSQQLTRAPVILQQPARVQWANSAGGVSLYVHGYVFL